MELETVDKKNKRSPVTNDTTKYFVSGTPNCLWLETCARYLATFENMISYYTWSKQMHLVYSTRGLRLGETG